MPTPSGASDTVCRSAGIGQAAAAATAAAAAATAAAGSTISFAYEERGLTRLYSSSGKAAEIIGVVIHCCSTITKLSIKR